jgi:arabinogalactan endo-1,4-beta-galactosidase
MFIKGMDISTLLEEETCGARYYDNGVEQALFAILKAYGTNSVRLRL